MAAEDLGDFTPSSALGPMRHGGRVTLGRLTTTEEQRAELMLWLAERAAELRRADVSVRVLWTNRDPTVVRVLHSLEHIDGVPVYLPREVIEMSESGGEVRTSEELRLRTLTHEVADLHERGML